MKTALLALALAATSASAQWVGGLLPPPRLTNFVGTSAGTLDGYAGRLVFLEFFMYW
jgi:hypothetical protein